MPANKHKHHLFYKHLARNAGFAFALVVCSLLAGTLGYHFTEGMPWLDALLNAAMILTGMGPVDKVVTVPGKLFATGYALFAGVVFLSTAALVLMPVVHRVLHRFHLECEGDES